MKHRRARGVGLLEAIALSSAATMAAGAALVSVCWSPDFEAACTNPGSGGFCAGTMAWCQPPPYKVDPNGFGVGFWEWVLQRCTTFTPADPTHAAQGDCDLLPPPGPPNYPPHLTMCRSNGRCCWVYGWPEWTDGGFVAQPRQITACPTGGGVGED